MAQEVTMATKTRKGLTLTIRIHLTRESPKPEMAPQRPAAEVVRQKDRKKPIQLKRNATRQWRKTDKTTVRLA